MMDETLQWLQDETRKRAGTANTYEQRAHDVVFEEFLRELAQRLETAQGELDGRMWDHEGWGE